MDAPAGPERSVVAAGSSSVAKLPAAIDGLDLQQMRLCLGCDDDVMLLILRQFLCDFGAWKAQFDQAGHAQDLEAQRRLVHTLKGTAANVGAGQLQATAQALEHALHDGSGPTAGLLQECDQALQRVLTALSQQLPPEAPAVLSPLAPEDVRLVMQN